MSTYRKKPVVIEAFQYAGKGNFVSHKVPQWMWEALESGVAFNDKGQLKLKTLESNDHTVSDGDFIIRGVKGELYACKPDIFALTYELVEGEKHELRRL
jgi:hypothetical protein